MDVQKVYRVLHRVTEKGFDTVGFTLGGTTVVLKTVSPHELDMVRYHASGKGLEVFRMYRMAYATFVLDGEMVLEGRPGNVRSLVDFYKSIPEIIFDELEETAIKLQNRYRRYSTLVEGYSYSPEARLLWSKRKGRDLLSTEATSIPGTSTVGTTDSIDVWALINMGIDKENESDVLMSNSLFVASATNPKGAQKIGSSMDKDKELAAKRRSIVAKYGNEANKRIQDDENVTKKKRWTADLDTTTAIMDELERQMTGVQDKHDLFIDEFRDRLTKELRAKEEAESKRLEEVRANRGGDPYTGSFAVSEEEMGKIQRGETTHMELAQNKAEEERLSIAPPETREGAMRVVGKRVIGARRGQVR